MKLKLGDVSMKSTKTKDWDHNCTGTDCPVAGCPRRELADWLKENEWPPPPRKPSKQKNRVK